MSERRGTNLRYGLNPTGSVWSLAMEAIEVGRADGVVTVTLRRPERKNALNAAMWNELLATFREIGESPDDRVVILTGAGGAFCSGQDLGAREAGSSAFRAMKHVSDVVLALHRLPQPTIAKVGGVAAGAGANLALGCDLVVASADARFSEIFARRGLSVDGGGSWLLPRLIGLHRAKELAFFADVISAAEAKEFGIVNRVVPTEELDAFVAEWARRLAAGPPIALALTKELLNNGGNRTMEQALDAEGIAQAYNFSTKDTAEAMVAFMEKRDPVFEGR